MNTNIFIPYPIVNIILSYAAGLNNMKWKPLLDHKTGKLKWNINNHNQATVKIENILKFKLENPPFNIPLLCGFLSCNAKVSILKKEKIPNYINNNYTYNECMYLLEYERDGFEEQAMITVLKTNNDDYIILKDCKTKNYIFRDYLPDPTFWISKIKGIIWNNYGLTIIINDHIDGWSGEWMFVDIENVWRFHIDLPDEFFDQDQEPWDEPPDLIEDFDP